MKKTVCFISMLALSSVSCVDKGNSEKNNYTTEISATKLNSFVNQLFLFQEIQEPGASKTEYCLISDKSALTGAMYITNKGNIIVNTINEQSDTQSFFWGKYKLTDTTITYLLTDEYYYQGKWDARWDVDNPDYSKGQTRKVNSSEVTLFRSKEDSLNFLRLYNEEEKANAAKKYSNVKPHGLVYWPYYEPKHPQKFYTWFYKQVPVLADL